jgi:hypothetical protein
MRLKVQFVVAVACKELGDVSAPSDGPPDLESQPVIIATAAIRNKISRFIVVPPSSGVESYEVNVDDSLAICTPAWLKRKWVSQQA